MEIHVELFGERPPVRIVEDTHYLDLILGQVNPRQVLRDADLKRIQLYFPTSLGIRVYFSAYVVILYKTVRDMEKAMPSVPQNFGGLDCLVDILELDPTTDPYIKITQVQKPRIEASTGMSLPRGTLVTSELYKAAML